jgi:hypothetical protein
MFDQHSQLRTRLPTLWLDFYLEGFGRVVKKNNFAKFYQNNGFRNQRLKACPRCPSK